MPEQVVAVTGATGFIGRALLEALVQEGWKIRALCRRPQLATGAVEWVLGDLGSRDALRNLVKGVSAVVHCAGQVRGHSLEAFAQTNVEGTRNLLDALDSDSPPRFLLISSLAAREPELSWYAGSKRTAEQIVLERSAVLPYAIFRPTAVYGPGDKEMSPLFRVTRRGILPMVGKPAMRFGLLHVNDLVQAILCWLSTWSPVQGTFELDDGTPGGYDSQQVALIAEEVWQRRVHCFFLPPQLVSLIAGINLHAARLLDYSPMLTPGKVRELRHSDWVCDISPLMQALPQWHPTVKLRDALRQAI